MTAPTEVRRVGTVMNDLVSQSSLKIRPTWTTIRRGLTPGNTRPKQNMTNAPANTTYADNLPFA